MFSSHFNEGVVLMQVFQKHEWSILKNFQCLLKFWHDYWPLKISTYLAVDGWRKSTKIQRQIFTKICRNFSEVKGVALIYSSSGIWLLAPVLIIQFWHKYFINFECSPATTFSFEVCGDYRWLARGRQIQSSNCQTKFSKRKLYTL